MGVRVGLIVMASPGTQRTALLTRASPYGAVLEKPANDVGEPSETMSGCRRTICPPDPVPLPRGTPAWIPEILPWCSCSVRHDLIWREAHSLLHGLRWWRRLPLTAGHRRPVPALCCQMWVTTAAGLPSGCCKEAHCWL